MEDHAAVVYNSLEMIDTFVFGPSRWSYVRSVSNTTPNSYISVQDVVTHIWHVSQNVSRGICTRTMCTRSPADTYAYNRSLHAPAQRDVRHGRLIWLRFCFFFRRPLISDVALKRETFIRYPSGTCVRRYFIRNLKKLVLFPVSFLHLSGHVALLLLFRTGGRTLFRFRPP